MYFCSRSVKKRGAAEILLVWSIAVFVCLALEQAEGASCVSIPGGAVSWWPGDGGVSDLIGTNGVSLLGGSTANGVGVVGEAFSFNGTTAFAQIPDSPSLRATNLTVECWLKFNSLDSTGNAAVGQQYIIFKQNTRSANFEGYVLTKERSAGVDKLVFGVSSAAGLIMEARSSTVVVTGAWYHVAGVRGSNFIQIFVNGQLQDQTAVNFPQDYGTFPLYFGSSGQSYWDRKFSGLLDEVTLYNRALSSNEISAIYLAGANGKCKAVSIDTQPQNLTRLVGESASFSVSATGLAPIRYQWRLNGNTLAGQTNPILNIPSVTAGDQGGYSVVVSNTLGAVTSQVAVLSVGVPPAITQHPWPTEVFEGEAVDFLVAASGTEPITYQWLYNGNPIAAANGSVYAIPAALMSQAGGYSAIASNMAGAQTSLVATLVVYPAAPVIGVQPVGGTVVEGESWTFTVGVSGTPPLGYQWLYKGAAIPGATASDHTISSVQPSQSGDYAVTVSNPAGVTNSIEANLGVIPLAYVPDLCLSNAIRCALGKQTGGLTVPDMSSLTCLSAVNCEMTNLSGIEQAVNLQSLQLSCNLLTDLGPLQSLWKLKTLALENNKISSIIPIAGLSNLTALSLSQNPITNIEFIALLSELESASLCSLGITNADFLGLLTSAKDLQLRENLIADISFITNFAVLARLDLRWNEITNIAPLSLGPASLSSLYLGGNRIPELPSFANLTNLSLLNLDHNKLNELTGLGGLSSLTYLSVGDNPVTNYSALATLVNLTGLEMAGSELTNLSFASGLHKLQFADFSWNKLTDLSPLLGLTNLQSLVLAGGKTVNLTQLPQAPALKNLWLHNSGISNMTFVAGMPALNYLNLERNQISTASALSGLRDLTGLALGRNPLSDLSPLGSLDKLESLRLEGLCLETANLGFLWNLASLSFLDLNFNNIEDVAFVSNMGGLSSLYLRKNCLKDIGVLGGLSDLRFVDLRRNALDLQSNGPGNPSQVLADLRCAGALEAPGCGELGSGAMMDSKPQNDPPQILGVSGRFFSSLSSGNITASVWDDSLADEKSNCPRLLVSATSSDEGVLSVVSTEFHEDSQSITIVVTNSNWPLPNNIVRIRLEVTDDTGAKTNREIEAIVVDNTPIIDTCPNTHSSLLGAMGRQANLPPEQLRPADLLSLSTITAPGVVVVDTCVWQWLTNVQSLNFYAATIPNLDFLTELENLKFLGLAGTNLPDTTALSSLWNLEHVDFSGTGLTNLDPILFLPPTIKRLDLARNSLRDLTHLARFALLSELSLNENRIVDVSALSTLEGLSRIQVQQNWITNINTFLSLPVLRYLDMRTNFVNLASGSPGANDLFNLTNATPGGNPVAVDFLTQRHPRFDVRTNWVVQPGVESSVNYELLDVHMDEAVLSGSSMNSTVLASVSLGLRTHSGGTLFIAPAPGIIDGTAVITLTATNDVPFSMSTNIVVFVTPWYGVGGSLDAPGWNWITSGEKPWFGQTRISHDGVAAAQSGAVNDLQLSQLETTLVGPGTLSFWWKVSSETNYDFLTLTNNNVGIGQGISGEVEWQLMSLKALPGTNRLTWTYTRDKDTSDGLDAAFLDEVRFVPDPYLVASGFTTGGHFQIGLQGVPGTTYRLQSSTNLQSWLTVGTVVFTGGQFAVFIDTNQVRSARFYRLKDAALGP